MDHRDPHLCLFILLASAMKLAMKMQHGELVVYSKTPKPLTGIQKQQLEQQEAREFWKALEKSK